MSSADTPDPRDLLRQALTLSGQGHLGEAARLYREAVSLARRNGASAEVRALLEQAKSIPAQVARSFEERLQARLAALGAPSPRIQRAVDIQLGRSRIYVQEPLKFYFPGLPQIQFYEREDFAWVGGLEAQTEAIAAELQGVLAAGNAFAPYVDRPPPGGADPHGMGGNMDWSACFLIKNGAPNPAMQAACPITMAALSALPLAAMPNRGPSILFSALKPGARIPPHNGFVNTRLICHLPLIAPEGCALRVGSETRPWRKGEMLIFDDSIEHEAWNGSSQLRVVLLFDVWRPELSALERAMVNALFEAVDEASGQPPQWDS